MPFYGGFESIVKAFFSTNARMQGGVLCFVHSVYALVTFSKPEMAPLYCNKAIKRKANIVTKNMLSIY